VEDLSLHLLDIAENSIDAGATRIEMRIEEDMADDILLLEVRDNGKGMDAEAAAKATDPFFTTRKVRRVGLGLPLLSQASEECGGSFSIASEKGKGTTVSASFKRSHIDRKPLGDIEATIAVLVAGNPGIDFILEYKRDGLFYRFDTSEIRHDLGEIPIDTPSVIEIIKRDISTGIRDINTGIKELPLKAVIHASESRPECFFNEGGIPERSPAESDKSRNDSREDR
jgi:anti-sigma regulatory factor (Ser/Thr protein kinase)